MRLCIVGVTGLVGQVILRVLEEFEMPVTELIPVASERSIGKKIEWKGQDWEIIDYKTALDRNPRVAIFSAGGQTSLQLAPKFAERDCYVIDNSSAWRMDPSCPLVVPEINAETIAAHHRIIANPNCSTIQMVMCLAPLHRKYGIKRVVVSTYQSFTGTGMKAVRQYEAERDNQPLTEPRAYAHPIFENCIPQCDSFLENRYTKEEMKMVNETRKILGDENIAITATAVRVPVHGGHSESVNLELKTPFEVDEVRQMLGQTPGVVVVDNPHDSEYPTPLQAKNKNEVFVGRIRRDESQPNSLNLWITADNLRKGAATNAVQIVQYLRSAKLI